jgi:hypothetical protein
MKKLRLVLIPALIALAAVSCGKKGEQASTPSAQPSAAPPAAPHVERRLLTRWIMGLSERRPGLDATKANTLGGGALAVKVTGKATSWIEMVDVDSSGTKEKVDFMWDATNKVMYAYTLDPVSIDDSTSADKGLLVAQFGDGNTRHKENGSGFWAYALERDTSATGTISGKLYGCRYNKFGEVTECGPAEWSRTGNEFSIKLTGK